MNYYNVTTEDLLSRVNDPCPECTIELDGRDYDATCRVTLVELSPLEDKIDRLELELIHIDNLNPLRFTPETRLLVTVKMLTAWSVRDEAQCQVTGVLDAIQEETGYRDTLWAWFVKCEEETVINRRAAAIDLYCDQRKEAM